MYRKGDCSFISTAEQIFCVRLPCNFVITLVGGYVHSLRQLHWLLPASAIQPMRFMNTSLQKLSNRQRKANKPPPADPRSDFWGCGTQGRIMRKSHTRDWYSTWRLGISLIFRFGNGCAHRSNMHLGMIFAAVGFVDKNLRRGVSTEWNVAIASQQAGLAYCGLIIYMKPRQCLDLCQIETQFAICTSN